MAQEHVIDGTSKRWSLGIGASIGFLMVLAVLTASAWLSYRNIRRVSDNAALVVRSHEVLDALRDTLAALTDAETGQRGYIITGEAPYLEPYEAALGVIRTHQSRLRELSADNRDMQRRVADLELQSAARLQTLKRGIRARDEGGAEGGRRFILAGEGKQRMDAIRVAVAEIEKGETDLLAARDSESRTGYRTSIVSLLVTALVGLSVIGVAGVLAAREAAARLRGAESLHRANEDLEERVRERTADLGQAVESLRRSNRELEQFASVASHDLQEPLRKIQAFGDRLQEKCADGLGEHGRQYVERMQASAVRMRSLIDALLTYSRVTTKAGSFAPIDLGAAVREVVSDLEGRIQQTGGRVDIGRLPTVEADPVQVRQLLQNLIGNGLKFHKPGEKPLVRVEGRLLPVGAGNGLGTPRCEVTVRDNGIGFEEKYLDRIFDVFQRLHGRQEYEGTGMGLAICRRIVERHRGSITATSAPDQGSTFLVTLPVQQAPEDDQ